MTTCENNLRKLLLTNGFIPVERRCQRIGSGDAKELIFFAILFVLNILYDVIRDAIYRPKHNYVRWISLSGQG